MFAAGRPRWRARPGARVRRHEARRHGEQISCKVPELHATVPSIMGLCLLAEFGLQCTHWPTAPLLWGKQSGSAVLCPHHNVKVTCYIQSLLDIADGLVGWRGKVPRMLEAAHLRVTVAAFCPVLLLRRCLHTVTVSTT